MISIGMLFWLVMIFWFLYEGWGLWHAPAGSPRPIGSAVMFLLFLLLGISQYGWPIKG